MVSQGSNCDSETGLPVYMQDSASDSGCDDFEERPILIAASVLQEVLTGVEDENLREKPSHLESEMNGGLCFNNLKPGVEGVLAGSKVRGSSYGSIPIAHEGSGFDSDEEILGNEFQHTINPAVRNAFAINKHDREELVNARRVIQELQGFISKKGFKISDVHIEEARKNDKFNKEAGMANSTTFIQSRDNFGLPLLTKDSAELLSRSGKNAFTSDSKLVGSSKVKDGLVVGGALPSSKLPKSILKPVRGSAHVSTSVSGEKNEKGASVSGEKNDKGVEFQHSKPYVVAAESQPELKSWSKVVNNNPSQKSKLTFEFTPRSPPSKVISPPVEVLKRGNDKFKACLVGSFTKGVLSYNKVVSFAQKMWNNKGLLHVSQKNNNTFVFRFNTVEERNAIMARGTWYIERRPMLVHAWGTKVGNVESIPLWVRFDDIPDCYWTKEGLGCLARAIGNPLYADDLTSQLEILPFARVCVDYKVGDELPVNLKVEVLDPLNDEKTVESVKVSYPFKPLICTSCKSLGHLAGACPSAPPIGEKRDFVPKKQSTEATLGACQTSGVTIIKDAIIEKTINSVQTENSVVVVASDQIVKPVLVVPDSTPEKQEWHTVSGRKKARSPNSQTPEESPVEASPPPLNVFKNLAMVDEIDAKLAAGDLSKSQRKKLKKLRSQGKVSPQPL